MHCSDDHPQSPWICHICDYTDTGESVACSVCYMTTCAKHLKHKMVLNRDSGLYELQPICNDCELRQLL